MKPLPGCPFVEASALVALNAAMPSRSASYTHLYDDQRRAAAIPLSQLLSVTPSESQPAAQQDGLVAQLQQLIAVLLKER